MNPFEIFAALGSNDLFMRRWSGFIERTEFALAASAAVDAEDAADDARSNLRREIRAGLLELKGLVDATLPGAFVDDALPYLVEVCYETHLKVQRAVKEQGHVRVTIIVDPEDGEQMDDEHVAIVHDLTDNELNGERWQELRSRLASCSRPARVWTADRVMQLEWETRGAGGTRNPDRAAGDAPEGGRTRSPVGDTTAAIASTVNRAAAAIRERFETDPGWPDAISADPEQLIEGFVAPFAEALREGLLTFDMFDAGVDSFIEKLRAVIATLRRRLEVCA